MWFLKISATDLVLCREIINRVSTAIDRPTYLLIRVRGIVVLCQLIALYETASRCPSNHASLVDDRRRQIKAYCTSLKHNIQRHEIKYTMSQQLLWGNAIYWEEHLFFVSACEVLAACCYCIIFRSYDKTNIKLNTNIVFFNKLYLYLLTLNLR